MHNEIHVLILPLDKTTSQRKRKTIWQILSAIAGQDQVQYGTKLFKIYTSKRQIVPDAKLQ